MSKTGLKIFAPATVANVAIGYDILGFALNEPGDEIIIKDGKQKGIVISSITGAQNKLSYDINKNCATVAAMKVLEHLGEADRPIDIELRKKMGLGTGMGSSAASAVAGAMAVNEWLDCPLTKRELLPFAVLGEQIADGAYHAGMVAESYVMVTIRSIILYLMCCLWLLLVWPYRWAHVMWHVGRVLVACVCLFKPLYFVCEVVV